MTIDLPLPPDEIERLLTQIRQDSATKKRYQRPLRRLPVLMLSVLMLLLSMLATITVFITPNPYFALASITVNTIILIMLLALLYKSYKYFLSELPRG